jgi:hypothetical protein
MALSKAGVDMNQISALLRHSNVAVTKKHYAEPDMGVLKKVVDNVRAMKLRALSIAETIGGFFKLKAAGA